LSSKQCQNQEPQRIRRHNLLWGWGYMDPGGTREWLQRGKKSAPSKKSSAEESKEGPEVQETENEREV